MKTIRTLLCVAVLASVSACSWMPEMPSLNFGDANTTASQRDNNLYGDERTASHQQAPAPVVRAATPAPAAVVPAPAPAPVNAPLTPEPTPAPISNAEPVMERNVTK